MKRGRWRGGVLGGDGGDLEGDADLWMWRGVPRLVVRGRESRERRRESEASPRGVGDGARRGEPKRTSSDPARENRSRGPALTSDPARENRSYIEIRSSHAVPNRKEMHWRSHDVGTL